MKNHRLNTFIRRTLTFGGHRSVLIKAIAIYVFILPTTGCKKENSKPDNHYPTTWASNSPPPMVSKNVFVVDSVIDLRLNLTVVDSTGLTFNRSLKTSLSQGMILVSGISESARFGFLRKIESVSILTDGSFYCKTSQARLTDAIVNGFAQKSFSVKDLFGAHSPNGVAKATGMEKPLASAEISESQDLTFSHDFGGVVLSGDIDWGAALDVEIDIEGAHIQKFLTELKSTKKISFKLAGTKSFKGSYDFLAGKYPLEPITIVVIGIPVVFKTTLILSIGIDGEITGALSMSVKNTTTDDLGLEYSNSTWNVIKSQTHDVTFEPPTVSSNLKVTPSGKLDLNLVPYGVNSAIFSSSIDLLAECLVPVKTTRSNSSMAINADFELKLSGTAEAKLFESSIANFSDTFLDVTFPVFAKTFNAPTLATSSITSITSTSAITGGSIASDGGFTVSKRGICWSTGTVPTISDYTTVSSGGSGSYTSSMVSLASNTTYYIRAYATNLLGTSYGNTLSFITLKNSTQGGSPTTGNNGGNTQPPSGNTQGSSGGNSQSGTPGGSPSTGGIGGSTSPPIGGASGATGGNGQGGSPITGNNGGNTQPPSGTNPGSTSVTASPAIGIWSNCATYRVNPGCNSFVDGVINARVVSVNEGNHTITFEVRKCDGTSFREGGYAYVISGLCSGIPFASSQFFAGQQSFQIVITDNNMRYTKFYSVCTNQDNGGYLYDAPEIAVNF